MHMHDGTDVKPKPADLFFDIVVAAGYPEPVRELRFARETHRTKTGRPRQWRFDFAWPDAMVAVEIEGGQGMMRPCPKCGERIRMGGRHQTASGFVEDCEKYLAAAELGWQVLRFPSAWVKGGTVLEHLRRVLTYG